MSDAPRPRGSTVHIHYRVTMPAGEVVIARVHGDGGVIASTSTERGLYRLQVAQRHVLAGRASGLAEPTPGCIRALLTYDMRGQTERIIDLRTCQVGIASEDEIAAYIERSRAYWWPSAEQPLGRVPVAAEQVGMLFTAGEPS